MRRILLAIAIAAAGVAVTDAPARAQMADAIGVPRNEGALPVGTLTVRIVEGEMSSPVSGTEVRLSVDGQVRRAVTPPNGRARFEGLPVGAKIQATADGETGEIASQEFVMPPDTGVALFLSTVPWKGDTAGAPAMGSKDRPPPRQMHGKARAEQGDEPGKVTVRLAYDDWDDATGTAGQPVVMVAYSSDDRIAAKVVDADAAGRAEFHGLDTTGNTAYYAMALLPRDGKTDRLLSSAVIPIDDHGMRLVLSGEKRDSGAAAVEDYAKSVPQTDLLPGQVAVAFGGAPEKGAKIDLYDLVTNKIVATTTSSPSKTLPSTVEGRVSSAQPDAKLPAGTVSMQVMYAMDRQLVVLPDVKLTVRAAAKAPEKKKEPEPAPEKTDQPASPVDPKAPVVPPKPEPVLGKFEASGVTDAEGNLQITDAPEGVWLEVVVEVEGKTIVGEPFALEETGALVQIVATWQTRGQFEALFENVAPTPRGAYMIEANMRQQVYRSPPFMVTAERGVAVPVYVLPRVAVTFQLDATVEDDYLAAHGTFMMQNFSFAPYAGPAEGLRIPPPAGATGLVVAERDQAWVSADPGAFRLLRPVPPFGGQFRAAFSIPVDDGAVTWDMPLPFGSYGSSLAIRQTPRMKVEGLPPRSKTQIVPQPNGTRWFAIQDVFIGKDKRMTFRVVGLPQAPGWHRVGKIVAGIAALALIVVGLVFALRRRPAPEAAKEARKQRKKRIDDLLDQVAALDRASGPAGAGKDDGRRDALIQELESLYAEDAEGA